MQSLSGIDLWKLETQQTHISTGSTLLDQLLGEGLEGGKVTEFCGLPGVGKTQLGYALIVNDRMQLCINVQLSKEHGGANGEAVYIDTEGSFVIKRLAQMGTALLSNFNLGSGIS